MGGSFLVRQSGERGGSTYFSRIESKHLVLGVKTRLTLCKQNGMMKCTFCEMMEHGTESKPKGLARLHDPRRFSSRCCV